MFDGYNKIFWGIFIVTFHINIGPVKILPPFIGLLLAYSGLESIYKEQPHKSFQRSKVFMGILTFMSLVGGIGGLFIGDSMQHSLILLIWIIIYSVIELIMVYKIGEGSIESLNSEEHLELAMNYIGKIRIYIIVFTINIILISVGIVFNIARVITIAGIIGIIFRIYLMTMISGLKKVYQE